MSRHRNLVNQIHDAEEEEYEDNYGDEDFDEGLKFLNSFFKKISI